MNREKRPPFLTREELGRLRRIEQDSLHHRNSPFGDTRFLLELMERMMERMDRLEDKLKGRISEN